MGGVSGTSTRPKDFHGIVEHKQLLARDILHLRIHLLEPRTIEFIAGQYIRLDSKPYGNQPAVSRIFILQPPKGKYCRGSMKVPMKN